MRTIGAILWETRPETIMTSAWRGEARKTSQPKRAMSKRGVPAAIISMAQQASPMVTGHMERAWARPASFSTVVSRKPGLSTSAAAAA